MRLSRVNTEGSVDAQRKWLRRRNRLAIAIHGSPLDATVAAAYARVPDDERLSTHSREPSPICCAGWRSLCRVVGSVEWRRRRRSPPWTDSRSAQMGSTSTVRPTAARSSTSSAGGRRCSGTRTARSKPGSIRSKSSTTSRCRSGSTATRSTSTAATSWPRFRSVPTRPRSSTRTRRSRSGRSCSRRSIEPGIVILLEVDSALPLTITASFRPRLRLMWPAPSTLAWAVLGCRRAPLRDQRRDRPVCRRPRLALGARCVSDAVSGGTARDPEPLRHRGRRRRPPAASDSNRRSPAASKAVRRLARHTTRSSARCGRCTSAPRSTTNVSIVKPWASPRRTPGSTRHSGGPRSGSTKAWRPTRSLGTGLVAGFRTSGDSERPGFAWFFGRDALWTTLATTAAGDFATTRTALDFLRRYQRAGRQDSTRDLAVGVDRAVVRSVSLRVGQRRCDAAVRDRPCTTTGGPAAIAHSSTRAWPSIVSAYRFSAATDTDGNGLIENTNVGHGWVEGGALYPPHEEIYLQGLWVAASQGIAELAGVMGDAALASAARAGAERTRAAIESTYWLPGASQLRVRDLAAAHHAAGRGARAGARTAAAATQRARQRPARRRGHGAARGADVVAHARPGARRDCSSIASAAARWPPTGATASSPTGARCTTRSRTTTGRSGRCSPVGRRWPRTATAARTSAIRR